MNLAATILAGDVKVIDAARAAHAMHQGMYFTDRGEVVIAAEPRPGWLRIAVKIKSPVAANIEVTPCAA